MIKVLNKNIKEEKHVCIDKETYMNIIQDYSDAFIGSHLGFRENKKSLWMLIDECLVNPELRLVLSMREKKTYEFYIDHFVDIDIMIDHRNNEKIII